MSPEQISRRRMLKRIGAGAAIAWSAPVLSSLRTPAYAQYPACARCEACLVVGAPQCGPDPLSCGPDGDCLCVITTEGNCDCFERGPGGASCVDSDDCQPNERCLTVGQFCCTTNQCLPLCGTS
jgi:hypothetical protein